MSCGNWKKICQKCLYSKEYYRPFYEEPNFEHNMHMSLSVTTNTVMFANKINFCVGSFEDASMICVGNDDDDVGSRLSVRGDGRRRPALTESGWDTGGGGGGDKVCGYRRCPYDNVAIMYPFRFGFGGRVCAAAGRRATTTTAAAATTTTTINSGAP